LGTTTPPATPRAKLEEVFKDENQKKQCHDQAVEKIEAYLRDQHSALPPMPLLSSAGPPNEDPVMQFHQNFDFEHTRCMWELYFVEYVSIGERLRHANKKVFLFLHTSTHTRFSNTEVLPAFSLALVG
jgi:hypothetical protein